MLKDKYINKENNIIIKEEFILKVLYYLNYLNIYNNKYYTKDKLYNINKIKEKDLYIEFINSKLQGIEFINSLLDSKI